MNKLICLLLGMLLWLTPSKLKAQDTFIQGTNMLSLGMGLPSYLSQISFLPLTMSYEYALTDGLFDKGSIGVGAEGELAHYSQGYQLFVGGRTSMHYEFVPNLDTYMGVALGIGKKAAHTWGFASKIHLGVRYQFNGTLGAFGELGINSFSILRAGVAICL